MKLELNLFFGFTWLHRPPSQRLVSPNRRSPVGWVAAYLGKQMIPQSKLVHFSGEDSWFLIATTIYFREVGSEVTIFPHAYNWCNSILQWCNFSQLSQTNGCRLGATFYAGWSFKIIHHGVNRVKASMIHGSWIKEGRLCTSSNQMEALRQNNWEEALAAGNNLVTNNCRFGMEQDRHSR